MVWLGHHEFGMEHRIFEFPTSESFQFDTDTLDYWVAQWINYYTYILSLDHHNIYFISYEDFLKKPEETLKHISNAIKTPFRDLEIKKFEKTIKKPDLPLKDELNKKAYELHKKLLHLRLKNPDNSPLSQVQ